jgi:hypothetical protein
MSSTPVRLLAVFLALATGTSLAADKDPEPPSGKFRTRRAALRKDLLRREGGNAASEKAVADGLRFLALHQANDGHWGLHDFNKHARTAPLLGGKVVGDDSLPGSTRRANVAGTAFGLLPFLAAGITHRAPPGAAADSYHKAVDAGLKWLMAQQEKAGFDKGFFGKETYSHALATLALCEAYGLTSDANLKRSAQLAIDYIVRAQHTAGGWRYAPGQPGDLSVTGFHLRALEAGRLAGLKVPTETFEKAARFLDSVEVVRDGGYSYIPGFGATPAMTAAGLLCRQQLGVNPRQAAGIKYLQRIPPGSGNRYYEYYATRVLFNAGGADWKRWNLGPRGTGKGGMRDLLIKEQDDGSKRKGNKGSWAGTDHVGGRIGATSMSLLTLQVYYRYARPALKAVKE